MVIQVYTNFWNLKDSIAVTLKKKHSKINCIADVSSVEKKTERDGESEK